MKWTGRLLSAYAHPGAAPFLAVMLVFGASSGLFMGVLNNYLHEILRIDRAGRGAVEFPRELPGLLLVGLTALMARFCEIRMVRAALVLSIAGFAGIGLVGDMRLPAVAMMVVWSTGEHLMMPLRQSVAVHMARHGREGHALGTVTGMQNLGQLAGYYLIPAVFALTAAGRGQKSFADYRMVFFLGAAVLAAGLLLSFRLRVNDRHMAREKLAYAPKFKKYYILEIFFGARKQVFLSFAPYVLILIYGAGAETLAVLYGISATLSILMSSVTGRIIDRFGYRVVLAADALLLVLLCVLYGFSHRMFSKPVAFLVVEAMFILDSVLFVVSIARASYVKSLSGSQNEMTSTLSTGISLNHLVSIVIALTGGLLWERLGVEVLFSLAGIFGIGSFLFSLTLPRHGIRESEFGNRSSEFGNRDAGIGVRNSEVGNLDS
jgi:predicted MFS family arabinose efflux permease